MSCASRVGDATRSTLGGFLANAASTQLRIARTLHSICEMESDEDDSEGEEPAAAAAAAPARRRCDHAAAHTSPCPRLSACDRCGKCDRHCPSWGQNGHECRSESESEDDADGPRRRRRVRGSTAAATANAAAAAAAAAAAVADAAAVVNQPPPAPAAPHRKLRDEHATPSDFRAAYGFGTGFGTHSYNSTGEAVSVAKAATAEKRQRGKKHVWLDGEKLQIECLSRKRSKPAMWLDYLAMYPDKRQRVSMRTFYRVVKALTGKQLKSVTAVDYMVSELLNENQARMKRLIDGEVEDASEAKRLISELERVFSYVRTGFPTKIDGEGATCPSLLSKHALGVPGEEIEGGGEITCAETRAVFQWFEELTTHVPERWHKLVSEAVEKIQIAMAHSVRIVVQQRRIREIETAISSMGSTEAKIILDYKMKLTPCHWRESSVLHYGKVLLPALTLPAQT